MSSSRDGRAATGAAGAGDDADDRRPLSRLRRRTEQICSKSVGCNRRSRRRLRSGEAENFRRTVCACLVAPGSRVVLPFNPEMAPESDGDGKNESETNSVRRLLPHIRREHPHFKICALMDWLHSKAPQVRLGRELDMKFIVGAKRGDHPALFGLPDAGGKDAEVASLDGVRRVFRWRNGAEPEDSSRNLRADVVEYRERIPSR